MSAEPQPGKAIREAFDAIQEARRPPLRLLLGDQDETHVRYLVRYAVLFPSNPKDMELWHLIHNNPDRFTVEREREHDNARFGLRISIRYVEKVVEREPSQNLVDELWPE